MATRLSVASLLLLVDVATSHVSSPSNRTLDTATSTNCMPARKDGDASPLPLPILALTCHFLRGVRPQFEVRSPERLIGSYIDVAAPFAPPLYEITHLLALAASCPCDWLAAPST